MVASANSSPTSSDSRLIAFRSDAELRKFLRRHVRELRRRGSEVAEEVLITGSLIQVVPAAAPSITNNQEASVDEGDIVKLHGNTLVILRRGRLFTVSIERGEMQPVDSIDAYPPSVDARGDWYDELLIAQDRIVVIGYSYRRRGTQINRFTIDASGRLKFEDAYQLRSGDYYSSRNYASRLVGSKLVFYTPLFLPWEARDPLDALPSLRKWNGTGAEPKFERISTARQVYVPASLRDDKDIDIEVLHTVTSCDLTTSVIDCDATSVLGSAGRSFYVSGNAVYVWVTDEWRDWKVDRPVASHLYRMPLDNGRPSAIGVRGAPVDQFSFREDEIDKTLNVLVRAESADDAFWAAERSEGAVALLRIPLASFANGGREVETWRYRALPTPPRQEYSFHNRFVGDYLLYGTGNDYYRPVERDETLVAVPIHGGQVAELLLPHGIDRIEVLGDDAVVVGSDDNNVYLSTIELSGSAGPNLGDRYVYTDAAQAETRSHAFFYHPDEMNDSGILGLPVARPAREAFRQLFEGSASVVFLRRRKGQFHALGELAAKMEGTVDDHCQASCLDWYGNARPIFIDERVFALLGYELVEGAATGPSIREIGRVSFAPAPRQSASR
jgi:hypothetical protein